MADCPINSASETIADFIYRNGSQQQFPGNSEDIPCMDFVSTDFSIIYTPLDTVEPISLNCGYCGASTVDYQTYGPWQIARRMLPDAQYATFGLGTNDIDLEHARASMELDDVAARMRGIIEESIALQPRLDVTILSVPEFALEQPIMTRFNMRTLMELNHAVEQLNERYQRMCQDKGWRFLDYASSFNQRRVLYGNTIHPNQRGYDVIAGLIAECMGRVIRP